MTSALCEPPVLEPGDPFGENPDHCIAYSLRVTQDGTVLVRVIPGEDLFLTLDRGPKHYGSGFVEVESRMGQGVHEIQVGFRHRTVVARAFTLTTAFHLD